MTTLLSTGNAYAPITASQVKTRGTLRPPEFNDDAALQLVVQDANSSEMWLQSEQWKLNWRENDILFQSPRTASTFEGSNTAQANVSRFTVAKHVNSLLPTMMSGIFYDSPPFVLRGRPGTTAATVRAKAALFSAILDKICFKQECEHGIRSQILNGTGIYQYGWTKKEKIEKKFVRKAAQGRVNLPLTGEATVDTVESDEFEVQEVKTVENLPFLEYCPLGTVLPDPGWNRANEIGKAKFVIKRRYLSFTKLNQLRDQPGYFLPSEEKLKELFFGGRETARPDGSVQEEQVNSGSVHHAAGRDAETTADPLEYDLKVDERWDNDRVMVVVQDKLLIRNEEHKLGSNSFLSANWWDIENAGYGIGIGRISGSEQRVEVGAINAALNILSFSINQQYVRSRGANAPTQQIRSRLGGIIDVDGKIDDALKILETPKVPAEIWPVIANSQNAGNSASGADEAMVQGNMPSKGGSSIGRTATGAGGIMAASAGRIAGPVGRFVDNVFIPFIMRMDEMISERMPLADIRRIIGEELGHELEIDFDNFLNARLKYEVLAGAHLAAKKAMAQSLPFLIQIFENPHMLGSLNDTGWTVDIKELFDMLMEMSEWKNTREVIRKFTPEEAEAYQQSKVGQAVAQIQGKLKEIQAKHEVTSLEIDQKAEAALASKLSMEAVDRGHANVQRQIVREASTPRGTGSPDAQYSTSGR